MLERHRQNIPSDVQQHFDITNSITFLFTSRLFDGEQRFDARYYSMESQKASAILESTGLALRPLVDVTDSIHLPKQFKRVYVRDKSKGVPLLTPSETLEFRPSTENYLIRSIVNDRNLLIEEGWMLLTCSGTVGRGSIVGDRLKRFAVSHDMIRIIPTDEMPVGYIYTFMQSWIGQALITKDQYGSTVKHLEAHHVADIPVPMISGDEQQYFHSLIDQVYSDRDDANHLLDDAERQLYIQLGLVDFEADEVGYIPPSAERIEAPYYKVAGMTLKVFDTAVNNLHDRFDASFHIPLAREAVNLLKEHCPYPVVQLAQLASDISVPPRFKRIYVNGPEHGVPFMQGVHVSQSVYHNLQYLSRSNTKNIEKWAIHKSQVLVTCSGTIGRIGIVTDKTNGWTATQHILRITANEEINPGYIAAFLMSPYGQCQLRSKEYGAVVNELTESDTASIMIPCPPKSIQDKIGNKIIEAFEKIGRAATLEEDAIHELEELLESKASSKSFLQTARELNLDGPRDWSSRIEGDLYGEPFDIRT